MRYYAILLSFCAFCFSCNEQANKENMPISLGDTITTASGLRYVFLKEGKGNTVRKYSKVEAYMDLYLNNSDSLFWSTETEKDSVLGFIHGHTSMISGFEEVLNYLREGDEIIAILPDSLAYGKEGNSGIPPGTTLIYNPLIIKHVSKPKILISDTLQHIVSEVSSQAAINFHEKTISNEIESRFHMDTELIFDLLDSLLDKQLYKETKELSVHFKENAVNESDIEAFAFYQMSSLEEQGEIEAAISIVDERIKAQLNLEWWSKKKTELQKKLISNAKP